MRAAGGKALQKQGWDTERCLAIDLGHAGSGKTGALSQPVLDALTR
jgi:hypothetical protein